MAVVSVVYFFIGIKAKHVGILVAGVLWAAGGVLVYKLHVWLVAPIVFILAILLNPNPEHS